MKAGGQARRGRGGSFGSREQAQADLDLVPPGPGTSAPAGGAAGGDGGGTRVGKRSGETGAPPSFLDKLCTILNEPRLSEHISWNQEGDGVIINQPDQFAKIVLPKYYKHSNYHSFVRQLNIYGFHKTRHDEDSCEFKQPNFKRDMPHLVGLIRRKGQGNNASAAGGRLPEGTNNSNKVAVEETKRMMDRVSAELRAVCNRVVHLEAEMGMINHRHNHLRLECQALLRVVLVEGGQPLAEKAVAALRQLPHVAAEAEMTELLSTCSHPEEQRQPFQRQTPHHQRLPAPSPPPFHGSTSTSTSTISGVVAAGVDTELPAAAGLLGARSGEGGANPPFSSSGAALASVVAAAIANDPPSHALGRADRADEVNVRGTDAQVRLGGAGQSQAASSAASPAPGGGFPLAFWPEAGLGGDSGSESLPVMPAAATTSLAPSSVSFGAHGSSGSSSDSRGVAGNAGAGVAESATGEDGGLGGVSSSSLFSDHEATTAAGAAAVATAAAVTRPLLSEFPVDRGGSVASDGGAGGGRGQAEARHAGVGDLEAVTRNKRKASGAVD